MNCFIEYPNCSTCKKAKKWLIENKIPFNTRHIVKDNPSKEEIQRWVLKGSFELKKLFNTSGNLYKEMNLKDKLKLMNEEQQAQLLSSDGMLVKRPVFVNDNLVLVGFKEEEWAVLKKI